MDAKTATKATLAALDLDDLFGHIWWARTATLSVLVALNANALAKETGDYSTKMPLVKEAVINSYGGTWRIGTHQWGDKGHGIVQFFTGLGVISFHFEQSAEELAAMLPGGEYALKVPAQTWDRVMLQPVARDLLIAFVKGGASEALAVKAKAPRMVQG